MKTIFVASLILAGCTDPDLTREQKIVALTLLAEARGEGVKGMEAVAMVIKQRMADRNQTASQVCLTVKQFSCWNGKGYDDLKNLWQSPAAPDAIDVVRRFNQLDTAAISHANHYCTLQVNPYWSKGKAPVAVIGNHKFFKIG